MLNTTDKPDYLELIYAVVNRGRGSKVLRIAKESSITGGTIALGRTILHSPLLELLALDEAPKEIVMMVGRKTCVRRTMKDVSDALRLDTKNGEMLYSVPVGQVVGMHNYRCDGKIEEESGGETMYQAITVIVEKGKGEPVVEEAMKAGAKGATIVNARGSGSHEAIRVFSMEIEPEKEIVLMITEREKTEGIIEALRVAFHIEQPGRGIIYVQNVSMAYGLAK